MLNKPFRIIPEPASAYAGDVDTLFVALVLYSAVLLGALTLLIGYFCIRYRAGSKANRTASGSKGSGSWLEIGWASVLLATFLAFFFWAGELYLEVYRGREDAPTINVLGKQWMWKIEHPEGAREINTLHVPVGQTIRLRLRSADVVHSFFVPALRLKKDAVPGMHNTVWITAAQTGTYHLLCAEYCGVNHSRMRGKVIVMRQADYQRWLTREGHATEPAAAGEALFRSYGCSGCHSAAENAPGPKLSGIFGRAAPLTDGTTVEVDEAYLRDSILMPAKQVVAGYEPIMPSFSGRISERELQNIIAYIRSLRPGERNRDDE